jgi:hypothetical protein
MSRRAKPKGEPDIPDDLKKGLEKNKKARDTFEAFPQGNAGSTWIGSPRPNVQRPGPSGWPPLWSG